MSLHPAIVGLLVLQGAATLLLLHRLVPGLRRPAPVQPHPEPMTDTTVSVIVPTLNEASRLQPCLDGLRRQPAPLTEVIVVDSGSTDGTRDLVLAARQRDSRIVLDQDPELPQGWIGKVWALQHGLSRAKGEWILGIDADTEPNDGLVGGAIAAARRAGLDLVSFAPRFAAQSAAERWLQPAMLASLVYRAGAPGVAVRAGRLLANGQCFLVRRSVLLEHGGYEPASRSFADDVRLARHYARLGVPCAFLDGRLLYRVRSYRSAREMWREWGRSIDLSDATPPGSQVFDLALLLLGQALPIVVVISSLWAAVPLPLVLVNLVLLSVRLGVLIAIAPSYERRGVPYYLSIFADPLAFVRVALSTFRRPTTWRGRTYA